MQDGEEGDELVLPSEARATSPSQTMGRPTRSATQPRWTPTTARRHSRRYTAKSVHTTPVTTTAAPVRTGALASSKCWGRVQKSTLAARKRAVTRKRAGEERVVEAAEGEGLAAQEPVALAEVAQPGPLAEPERDEHQEERVPGAAVARPPGQPWERRLEVRAELGEQDHHDRAGHGRGNERARRVGRDQRAPRP